MLRQTMCLLILTRSQLWQAEGRHGRTLAEKTTNLSEERSIVISGSDIPDIPCQFVLYLYGSFESNHKSVTFNFSSSETSCADAVLTPTGLSSVKMQSSRHQERCGHVLMLCSRRFTWTLYIFAGDQNYDEILTNWNSRQSSCRQV